MFVSINYIFIKNLFEAAYVRTFCDEVLFQGVRFRWEHFASLIGKLMLIGRNFTSFFNVMVPVNFSLKNSPQKRCLKFSFNALKT